MRRIIALVVTLPLLVAACGDDDTATTSTTTTTVSGITSTTRAGTTTSPPGATTTAVPSAPEETSLAVELGFPEIALSTPASGGGTRPVLEWAPVEGADHYLVAVRTPSDEPYWAWRTADTSVPVGGLPRLNEEAAGPSIVDGMDWSVLAIDADGNVIAAGNHRPIAP